MTRTVAFLRSINVGGRRVTNDQLVDIAVEAGLLDVQPFLASGNLIFELPERLASKPGNEVESFLAAALESALGYPVPVFVRNAVETRALAEATPFTEAELGAVDGKPQVTLLAEAPTKAQRTALLACATDNDKIVVGEREWFWLPAHGVSGTDLRMTAVEAAVGVGTTRTCNTVQRITKKYLS